MDEKKRKWIIGILAILLAVSLCILAGVLFYRVISSHPTDSVVVPDNIITPDAEAESSAGEDASSVPEETAQPAKKPHKGSGGGQSIPVLRLYSRHTEENAVFQVENLFPGDRETRSYCVQVSYEDGITMKFRAAIRPGYEKLAEALKCKITLTTTGQVLYDGLMRDMPTSLDHPLRAAGAVTENISYEITVSMDTSVGNEYQNQTLIADFHWWVDDEGMLTSPPRTGDQASLLLWLCLGLISLLTVFLLLWARRKEKQRNGNER